MWIYLLLGLLVVLFLCLLPRQEKESLKLILRPQDGNIAQLVNHIIQTEKGNVKITLEPGVYPLDDNIIVDQPGIQIEGERGAILRKMKAASIVLSSTRALIKNIEIDGNSQPWANIFISGSYNEVNNVNSHHSADQGIAIDGGHGANDATTCSNPPHPSTAQFNVVEDCLIQNNGGIGISCYHVNNCRLINNTITDNDLEGLTLDVRTSRCIVDSNRIHMNCKKGGVGGIGMDCAALNIISNNQISSSQTNCPGIKTQNNVGICYKNTIEGNMITDNQGDGIWLYLNTNTLFGCNENLVTGNMLHNNGGLCIEDDNPTNQNTIINNAGC